jgi:hypothetical protein
MTIHTFGDSHAHNGWDGLPRVSPHWLGPKLCFSAGRDGIDIKTGYDIREGDVLIFAYGEIDCRCHIHKHIDENNTYQQIIDTIVSNYFVKIKEAASNFPNVRVGVYNVVPAVRKDQVWQNSDYPHLGTDEERKQYVLYFNGKLKETCASYGYIFVDVYNHYIDQDGFLNRDLSDGAVHIRDNRFIREFLENTIE